MKDVVQPGWTWGFRCLGFDFLFVKPLCVSHSQQVFPLIHEVEMLLFLTEKKNTDWQLLCLQQPLVCVWEERELNSSCVCTSITQNINMDSSDISDQVLSVLLHWREPGRLSKVTAVRKSWNRKITNQSCHDLLPALQEQKVTVSGTRSLLHFPEHQKAELPGLLWEGAGCCGTTLFPGIFPLSTEFLVFLSELVFLTMTKWLMSQFSTAWPQQTDQSNGWKYQNKKK